MKKLIFLLLIWSIYSISYGQFVVPTPPTDSSDVADWGYAPIPNIHDTADIVRGEIKDTGDVYYATITDFGKITDDSTHWNTAYGWGDWAVSFGKVTDDTTALLAAKDSVAAWDNGGIASANIVDQTITKSDIDTTSSNIPFNNAYKGTTAQAESILVTHGEMSKLTDDSTALLAAKDSVAAWDNGGIVSANITDQTITKNDIDTTSSNIPFNNAYKVTTAVADSAYITKGYVDHRYQYLGMTIVLPKNVYDSTASIPFAYAFSATATIDSLFIETDNSSSYSVIFEEWSAPQTETADIDTIATSTSYLAGGVPSDVSMAAGSRIKIRLPATTGTKALTVRVKFHY